MPTGNLALVLHAHLPFVRHPEHAYHLEENWLYEAIAATYLPLLEVWRGLHRDGVRVRVTMSMSPPLCAMLRDELLQRRAAAYLERLVRLSEQELRRGQSSAEVRGLAEFYGDRFDRLASLYRDLRGDVVGAFRDLEEAGVLEIITVGGTHGFQPAIRDPKARRAQIAVACESHRACFGRSPRGIWLPECGYDEGVDQLLAEEGIRFFFVDSHALTCGRPRPPLGPFAPVYTRAGVAAFARDVDSSKQVWSAVEGYPGDPAYRDFYRDVGFDRPLDEILPFIHPDGIRVHTGLKYHRVTGKVDLSEKQLYDPRLARQRAADHAAHFLAARQAQVKGLSEHMSRPPLVISPFDAELYGHWWFEGPWFLDFLLRKIHFDQSELGTVTPSDYLAAQPTNAVCELTPSSWGDGGYNAVWVDPLNDWIIRHQHRAEQRMRALASSFAGGADPLTRRALDQAARELLLLQSSDWAFILKTQTAMGYAAGRAKAHVARFRRLDREITSGSIDAAWLADLEARDNIFPEIDYRRWA
jgi:1,4-alpha-glucan branching enzyme